MYGIVILGTNISWKVPNLNFMIICILYYKSTRKHKLKKDHLI